MRFLVLFCILIFLSNVSATEVGISPSKISLATEANKEICRSIHLFSDSSQTLQGEDKWSLLNSKNLKDYTLKSQTLGIKINYISSTEIKGKKKIEICISGTQPGVYYGALIFYSGNAGVGTWIRLSIKGNRTDEATPISEKLILTGNSIDNSGSSQTLIDCLITEIFISIILLSFLAIKYIKARNLNRQVNPKNNRNYQ